MAGELCILEYVSDGMEAGDDSQIMLSLVYKNMLLLEQEKEALRY